MVRCTRDWYSWFLGKASLRHLNNEVLAETIVSFKEKLSEDDSIVLCGTGEKEIID